MIYNYVPQEVITKFSRARSIALFTGAGISLESGVPLFRGKGGFGYFGNLPADYFASLDAWIRYPDLVREFYQELRAIIKSARPGIVHQTIHGWELRRFTPPLRFNLITQNFDGLHKLIGNEEAMELHGNIWQMRCCLCHTVTDLVPFRHLQLPKNCYVCNGPLRPNILFIDESVPEHLHRRALSAVEQSDIFMAIGVSGVTRYAQLLAQTARRKNRWMIEINPQPSYISRLFDISIMGRAEDIVPQFYWDYVPGFLDWPFL